MKQRLPQIAACCLLALALALPAAEPPWRHDAATHRLRFGLAPDSPSDILLPLPLGLPAPAAVHAVADADGRPLPASLVRVGDKPVAVAVHASAVRPRHPGRGKPLPAPKPGASVYLLAKPLPEAPAYTAGRPVRLQRTQRSVTTRAHTADEMVRMFARLHLLPYPQAASKPTPIRFQGRDLAAFGVADKPEWLTVTAKQPSPYLRGLSIATAAFVVEREDDYRFTADQPHVGWAVLVDGNPVDAWGRDGAPEPPPLRLKPGLHSLQLLTIQSLGEPIPKPLVRIGKAAQPTPPPFTLLPAFLPDCLALQTRDAKGTIRSAGATLDFQEAFVFPHARNQAIDTYAVTLTDGVALLPPALRAGALAILPDHRQPALSLSLPGSPTVRLDAAPPVLRPARALDLDLRPTVPVWQEERQPLTLAPNPTLPALLPKVLADLIVCDVRRAHDGQTLASAPLAPPQPSLAVPPPIRSGDLTVHATLAGRDLTPPRRLHLLAPADAAQPLLASGSQLLHRHDYAPVTLLIDAAKANSDTPSSVNQKTPVPIVLLDDTLLVHDAPGASAVPAPDDALTLLRAACPPGAQPELAFPAALSRLADAPRGALACLFVNSQRAAANTPAWRQSLRFAVAACRALGLRPVVTIPPPLDGEDGRQAAFHAQCLALSLGADLIDLSTQARLQALDTSGWRLANGVRTATIHDDARRWLFQTLRQEANRLLAKP